MTSTELTATAECSCPSRFVPGFRGNDGEAVIVHVDGCPAAVQGAPAAYESGTIITTREGAIAYVQTTIENRGQYPADFPIGDIVDALRLVAGCWHFENIDADSYWDIVDGTRKAQAEALRARLASDLRAEYIAGLRALADALEAHPELELPYNGRDAGGSCINVIPEFGRQREQLAAWARVLPGHKDKTPRDDYFDLTGAFHGLHIKVICKRDEVCERIVLGTREVTEKKPDPALLAEIPLVTVTHTEEIVEWRCTSSILAGASA